MINFCFILFKQGFRWLA
uniref:Uncharacterized protein n=1 Tax=Salix viminalis TaxID=40686 RepID=A0A6N2LME2_SALVM